MANESVITEIGPDLYRLSVYVPDFDLQFNHFLVDDDEPLLYHAGLKGMFPLLRDAVATVIDPSRLRWIGFSHFESDECGGLNDWLAIAPGARPACGEVGALVSVNDFATRPPRALADGEQLVTGKYRFRFCRTPHLPHGWDASVLFEETQKTLLCSDLFHQAGNVEPLTTSDIVGRFIDTISEYQTGVLADYSPYSPYTATLFEKLARLNPERLAIMHGSSFHGDGAQALLDLGSAFKEVFGQEPTTPNDEVQADSDARPRLSRHVGPSPRYVRPQLQGRDRPHRGGRGWLEKSRLLPIPAAA